MSPSPPLSARLLGAVFAAADLVIEIDAADQIAFALGAARQLTGQTEAALSGQGLEALLAPADAQMVARLAREVVEGRRLGPLQVTLAKVGEGGAGAQLWLFRAPAGAGTVSCAISRSTGWAGSSDREPVVEVEAFAEQVQVALASARAAGGALRMDLVELAGLDAKLQGLGEGEVRARRQEVTRLLQASSLEGQPVGALTSERFAMMRGAEDRSDILTPLRALTGLSPTVVGLEMHGTSPVQNARAMRYALTRYIEDGAAAAAMSFTQSVERTARDTDRFRRALSERSFCLSFQPVIRLAEQGLHHFEALARFEPDASPAGTIRLAEELEMIADFDLAVAEAVGGALLAAPDVHIALNVSAQSLLRPDFLGLFAKACNLPDQARGRLLVEITETSAMHDLDRAAECVARLQAMGHRVCIDDFGAGAASLDYLRALKVDLVKFDGKLIRNLATEPRDLLIVRHMVNLCRDLGAGTVAEMVETSTVDKLLRECGVDLAQGWFYARPLATPNWEPPGASAPSLRGRRGKVERTWS